MTTPASLSGASASPTEPVPIGAVPVLAVPLLHPDSAAARLDSVTHLWPGLPRVPETGFWQPADYPFSPQQAAACLADLQAMSEAALSGVPLQALAAREHRPQAAKHLEEQAALARFAEDGQAPKDTFDTAPDTAAHVALHRKAAQKVLLWAWLLEERYREVRELSRSWEEGAGHLVDALAVEDDAALAGLSALDMHLGDAEGLLPSWKLVLENAALFLPSGATLVVNSAAMARDLPEELLFSPLDQQDMALPATPWEQCRAPLWRVLGLAAVPGQRPWLHQEVRLLRRLCENTGGKA